MAVLPFRNMLDRLDGLFTKGFYVCLDEHISAGNNNWRHKLTSSLVGNGQIDEESYLNEYFL